MRRWLFVVLAACGGTQAPKEPPVPSCAQVADGMLANMQATQERKAPAETTEMIKDIIRTACDRDRWSPDARRCMATMQKTTEDADRCASKLTDEQVKSLIRDEEARLPKRQGMLHDRSRGPGRPVLAPPLLGAPLRHRAVSADDARRAGRARLG
jgi:hypothetical protein